MAIIDGMVNAVKDFIKPVAMKTDIKTVDQMDDDDFLKEIDTVYKMVDQKYVYERQWYLNLSFLMGQQWIEWSNKLKKLYEPKVPEWRVRHVSNDIMPTFRKKMGKLNKNRPTMFISAGAKGPDGEATAKESNKLIEYWWSSSQIGMEDELLEWKLYAMACGTGFIKPYWDPTIGTERSGIHPVTGVQMDWRDGEVQLEACSPFELVFNPPTAKKWKDLESIMHYKVRTLSYIKARYPEKGGEVVAEKDVTIASSFWQKVQQMVGVGEDAGLAVQEKQEKSAIVKELWIYPCERFPNGQKIVSSNKILLEHTELPYHWLGSDERFIGIVPLHDFKPPGRNWGRSDIEDQIPIQRAKNELISHVRESERLCSKPKFMNPKGSGIESITSEPGENVEYDTTTLQGHEPHWMVPPPIPSYVISGLGEIYQRDFSNVASTHEISRGQVPPGVTSGIAIDYLQEQDDTVIGDISRQYERAIEVLGNMMLSIAHQNYIEKRTLQITGDDGVSSFEYKPQKIDQASGAVTEPGTVPEGARVVVEAGSSMPRSQAAKKQLIMDLYKMGMLGNPADPQTNKRALSMLEMGSIDDLYEEEALDRSQAQVENEGMRTGISQQVMPFQDHKIHLEVHEAFMKGPEFMKLSPQIQQGFMDHRKQHQDLIPPPPGATAPTPSTKMNLSLALTPMDLNNPQVESLIQDAGIQMAPAQGGQ